MEEVLKQILSKLNNIECNVKELTEDNKELKGDIKELKGDNKNLKGDIKELKETVNRIEKKLDVVQDQTARTCEDITLVNNKLDILSKDLNMVEAVTGKNMTDIAYLKAVK